MGEMDQGFKRLFILQMKSLLEWLLGAVKDIVPLPTDLATERQLLPDTLYRATFVRRMPHPGPRSVALRRSPRRGGHCAAASSQAAQAAFAAQPKAGVFRHNGAGLGAQLICPWPEQSRNKLRLV